MECSVENNENTNITIEDYKFNKWDENNLYGREYSVESLIETLRVVQAFKRKYPNDEFVLGFDEILRDEICKMFGGSIYIYDET